MLKFKNKKFKNFKPIGNFSFLKKGEEIPEELLNNLFKKAKEKLEESDPMTILAAEAKEFAKETRAALFPDLDDETFKKHSIPPGSLFAGNEKDMESDEPEEEEDVFSPEELTITKINEKAELPKPQRKPRKSLKDQGVEKGEIQISQIIEAVLLCTRNPLTPKKIAAGIVNVTESDILEAIDKLNEEYEESNRSFRVFNLGGNFQIRTLNEFSPWLKEVFVKHKTESLTPAAIETLAIIAYKQPITKLTIDSIRGVDCGGHVRNLMEKGLAQVCGKSPEIGNPNFYGTSQRFLEAFGLKSLDELPSLDDLKDLN